MTSDLTQCLLGWDLTTEEERRAMEEFCTSRGIPRVNLRVQLSLNFQEAVSESLPAFIRKLAKGVSGVCDRNTMQNKK